MLGGPETLLLKALLTTSGLLCVDPFSICSLLCTAVVGGKAFQRCCRSVFVGGVDCSACVNTVSATSSWLTRFHEMTFCLLLADVRSHLSVPASVDLGIHSSSAWGRTLDVVGRGSGTGAMTGATPLGGVGFVVSGGFGITAQGEVGAVARCGGRLATRGCGVGVFT